MSMRANPTAIGLFLIGAVVLAVIGVATLASATWFSPQSTFISFFQESVNGLEPGAAVKFQGAPIGRVTDILIQIDERDKTFRVPVRYDIDLTRLTTPAGSFVNLNAAPVLRQQIADGLRAQLQMESVVTGQLYVELTYREDPPPPEFEARPTPYPEIPTAPSLLTALGTGAGSLVADVLKVLFRVNEMLEGVDMKGINAAVVASAQSVQRLVESPEILAAMAQVPGMTTQVSQTMAELQRLAERAGAGIEPMQTQLESANRELVLTLQALRKSIDETHEMLTSDSGVGYRLEQALASFTEAAEALRVLAVSLEQNPDMLIRGKKPSVK
jgi:phospholipid/cholesterol/gamma-HCH transport system substrate-binding protein